MTNRTKKKRRETFLHWIHQNPSLVSASEKMMWGVKRMRYRQLKGVSDLFTHYFLCFVVGVWGVLRDVDRKEGKEMIKQAAKRTRKGNQYRFILNSFYSSFIFFLMDFIKGFPFLLRHKNFLCPSFVHKEFICSLPGLCNERVWGRNVFSRGWWLCMTIMKEETWKRRRRSISCNLRFSSSRLCFWL